MKFSINDFSSKCDQISRKPLIWSHLLNKSNTIVTKTGCQSLHSIFLYELHWVFERVDVWYTYALAHDGAWCIPVQGLIKALVAFLGNISVIFHYLVSSLDIWLYRRLARYQ